MLSRKSSQLRPPQFALSRSVFLLQESRRSRTPVSLPISRVPVSAEAESAARRVPELSMLPSVKSQDKGMHLFVFLSLSLSLSVAPSPSHEGRQPGAHLCRFCKLRQQKILVRILHDSGFRRQERQCRLARRQLSRWVDRQFSTNAERALMSIKYLSLVGHWTVTSMNISEVWPSCTSCISWDRFLNSRVGTCFTFGASNTLTKLLWHLVVGCIAVQAWSAQPPPT